MQSNFLCDGRGDKKIYLVKWEDVVKFEEEGRPDQG